MRNAIGVVDLTKKTSNFAGTARYELYIQHWKEGLYTPFLLSISLRLLCLPL
jgi:hypothetical protein